MSADIMAENDNGRLVRVDHTNTYEGTATVGGKVIKKKFRCTTREDAITRWRSWQEGKRDIPRMEEVVDEMSVTKNTNAKPDLKTGQLPNRVSVIKFKSGRSMKVMAVYIDADKALDMLSDLNAALEFAGADGESDVDEVDLRV